MTITAEMIPWIVASACALFAFGYAVGHALGKIDGEANVAEYYAGRMKRK